MPNLGICRIELIKNVFFQISLTENSYFKIWLNQQILGKKYKKQLYEEKNIRNTMWISESKIRNG